MVLSIRPEFVSRQTAAARCEISVDTWDKWARDGFVPPPHVCRDQIQRWHWPTVEAALVESRKNAPHSDPFVEGISRHAKGRNNVTA